MKNEPTTEPLHEALPPESPSRRGREASSTRWLVVLTFLSLGMFGFAYANAQFFVMICQKVGLIAPPPTANRSEIDTTKPLGRPLEVYFSAEVNDGLPIVFTVKNRYQKVRVNERAQNDYRFVNTSNKTIYFKPVHDVSPLSAGKSETLVLEKCFCFDLQKIEPFQTYTLPVVYTFNETLEEGVSTLKMAYALFPSDKESYDAFMKAKEADAKAAKETQRTDKGLPQ